MSNQGGIKHDQAKPRMELLDRYALEQIARVMGYGALKYSAHNWRGGINWSRVLAAAMRHLHAYNDGEDVDPETGINHLAHAGCCIMFLLNYSKEHPELDDRFKRSPK